MENKLLVRVWRTWECEMVQSLWKTICRFLKKLKQLPYDPAAPLLGIYPEELKTDIQTNTCTQMFIVALFTVLKR